MKFNVVSALAIALMIGAWVPSTVNADEESYFKVEIKGIFRACNSMPGVFLPAVNVAGETYSLDLKTAKAKLPDEKQLRKLDQETVIVYGRLILEPGRPPVILVTNLTFGNKPVAAKSR